MGVLFSGKIYLLFKPYNGFNDTKKNQLDSDGAAHGLIVSKILSVLVRVQQFNLHCFVMLKKSS